MDNSRNNRERLGDQDNIAEPERQDATRHYIARHAGDEEDMTVLVRAAQRGDEQAFYELMNRHKDRLYRLARSYLRHEHDAFEAVQEAVCRAYMKLHTLREAQYCTTWLIRILLNVCADELKRRGKRPQPIDFAAAIRQEDSYGHGETSSPIEDRLELEAAVNKLGDREKQIILLKYYEDMTISDIARVLECPPGTVKTRLHRALLALRSILGKRRDTRD